MTTITETPVPYYCYCGCGGMVEVTFPGGFHGTTARISPCPKAPKYVASFEVRKSAVLDMEPVSGYETLRHRAGLVTFGGAR